MHDICSAIIVVDKSGIHIHFLSELSARRVNLMAFLPGSNLGCPDKRAELQKE